MRRTLVLGLLAWFLVPAIPSINMAFGDHHHQPDPGEPIDIPIYNPGGGRRDPPPDYRGGTRVIWGKFKERYGECNPNASRREIKEAYDDWFLGRSSGFSCTLKKAGICADSLSNLSFRIWILRHDDIVTYTKSVSMDGLSNSDEYSGGWFPKNDQQMFEATALYLAQIATGYVPGYVKSATRASSCDMPTVSDSEYTRIRGNMRNTSWTDYHFFQQNCQHWAKAHI